MLRFLVHGNGTGLQPTDLNGAYLVGSDGIPLRGEIVLQGNEIHCSKRTPGPAGIVMLWPIKNVGRILIESARLLEREQPYNLSLELARGRLMRIDHKREEWGLFDFPGMDQLNAELGRARNLFVAALQQSDNPPEAAVIAEQALQAGMIIGDKLSLFHADIFLGRRRQTRGFNRRPFGCMIDTLNTSEGHRRRMREAFDFAHLPLCWRDIEPKEGEINWKTADMWIEWLTKHRIPIMAGPLVSLADDHVPDWLQLYEHDYETVRNLIFEHVRRVVERYGKHVQRWGVVSGIHAGNTLLFNFEQLMELTRVAATLVKQLAPRATSVVEITSPWGEYYARNQRTIPPQLYADMAVQSGIGFDAFGLQFQFGPGVEGMFIRDMFQISSMIDRIGNLGKPLHISAVQVPSSLSVAGGSSMVPDGGYWREQWNEQIQAAWLRDFYQTALSKPFVETITWRDLVDQASSAVMPNGGLVHADYSPKQSFVSLLNLRSEILGATRKPPRQIEE